MNLFGIVVAASIFIALGFLVLHHTKTVLSLLIVYLPLESIFLRYLPSSGAILSIMYIGIQAVILALFISVVILYILEYKKWRQTPLDLPLLLFIILFVVSMTVNGSPLKGSIENLNAILKYVPLFYVCVYLDWTPRELKHLLSLILIMGGAELLVGFAQIFSPNTINTYLFPRAAGVSLFGTERISVLIKGREIGSIYGTFGDTIHYSIFLLVVLSVYLGMRSDNKKLRLTSQIRMWGVVILVTIGIGYSYSRASILGVIILITYFAFLKLTYQQKAFAFTIVGMVGILGLLIYPLSTYSSQGFVHPKSTSLTIYENFKIVFTRDYLERARNQRLGALLEIVPTVLVNRPLIGYGPDTEQSVRSINEAKPTYLSKDWSTNIIEDVYWVALFSYYGIFGPILWCWIFGQAWRTGYKLYRIRQESAIRWVGFILTEITLWMAFLLFFIRNLEFRTSSFFLWLFFGLSIAALRQSKQQVEGRHLAATCHS